MKLYRCNKMGALLCEASLSGAIRLFPRFWTKRRLVNYRGISTVPSASNICVKWLDSLGEHVHVVSSSKLRL